MNSSKKLNIIFCVLILTSMVVLGNSTKIKASETQAWETCAWEGGQCNLPGTCNVRFGLEDRWTTRYGVSGSFRCDRNSFGNTDPFHGREKKCERSGCYVDPFKHCSGENARCNIPGGKICNVKYGAGSGWAFRNDIDTSFDCNSSTFGGDPAGGQYKSCFINCRDKVETDWKSCAGEGGWCSVTPSKICEVRYGAETRWASRQGVMEGIKCNNSMFGNSDPAPGKYKGCQFKCSPISTGYVKCAAEGETCSLPLNHSCTVRYGMDVRWKSRNFYENFVCNSQAFFGDAAPGAFKMCSMKCQPYGPDLMDCVKNGVYIWNNSISDDPDKQKGCNEECKKNRKSKYGGRYEKDTGKCRCDCTDINS